ncbi:hypothetical protein ACFQ0M_41630 [Kitasatospora aburaviensis]
MRLLEGGTDHTFPPVSGAPWHAEWFCGPAEADAPLVAAALGRGRSTAGSWWRTSPAAYTWSTWPRGGFSTAGRSSDRPT